ncbi:MAG TPA: KGG domain-containing protein [Candidatus Xenobia bacterium]|jgi:hypothetical protein
MPERQKNEKGKERRGFASMDATRQRQIASMGGKAAHEKGTAHEFDSNEARVAGRKGGEAVSRDRQHMAQIGRKGGETVSGDRVHMAQIGSKGGHARSERQSTRQEQPDMQKQGSESLHRG